jgi:phosphoenolpyruvate carboxykinase (GTP)
MRVLKWIIDRIEGKAQGIEHMVGVSPAYEEMNWNGLNFGVDQFKAVTSISKTEWQAELKMHTELFTTLAHHLPQALVHTQEQIEKKLSAMV